MKLRILYEGVDSSPWMDRFMEGKLMSLERYVPSNSVVTLTLGPDGNEYRADLEVETRKHKTLFSSLGDDLYESFSLTLAKAGRYYRDEFRKVKDKYQRKFVTLTLEY